MPSIPNIHYRPDIYPVLEVLRHIHVTATTTSTASKNSHRIPYKLQNVFITEND